jgi:WD40 repeat protein
MKIRVASVLLLLAVSPLPGRADSTHRREIVDLNRFELLRTVSKGYTHTLAAGGHAFAVFDANVVRLVDSRDEKEFQTLIGHTAIIHDAGWSPDGRFIATSGFDAQVKVWDAATGKAKFTLAPHTGFACSVAFSADGKILATGGSQDGLVKLFDAENGREQRVIRTPDATLFALAFTPDGRHLVVNHSLANRADDSLRIIKLADGTDVRNVVTGAVTSFAVSRDGRMLAYSNPRGDIVLLETTGWTELKRLAGHQSGASAIAFHPVSRYLASVGRDGAVRLWDTEAGKLIKSLPIKEETDSRLVFGADGLSLLVAISDGTVQVYGRVEPVRRLNVSPTPGTDAKPERAAGGK